MHRIFIRFVVLFLAQDTFLYYNETMDRMYEYMENYIQERFLVEKTLRQTPESVIQRLCHQDSRKHYILRRFQGDSSAVRSLIGVKCAHLPRIYEVAQDADRIMVLEEYIPGDTLSFLCQGMTLESEEVRRIVLDICDALYILYSRKLVHRDVKPENVIVCGDRSVLIDFNTIRRASPQKEGVRDTRILGTLGYAPPEQYGLSQTDSTADIYALGVLINVLLTGKHPSLQLVGGHWGRIVTRCTMTSPGKRYQTVQAIRESL